MLPAAPRLSCGTERASVMRSATPSRRLSRAVRRLARLMKCRPDGSITPGTVLRSKVRSMEPLAGSPRPAYSGLAPLAYRGSDWLVMPCSGRSTATTTKPASANESATANMSSRLRVMPCWKITSGQPAVGLTAPNADAAFGTLTSTGICRVAVGTGSGLKRVTSVLVVSKGNGGACQYSVSGAVLLE